MFVLVKKATITYLRKVTKESASAFQRPVVNLRPCGQIDIIMLGVGRAHAAAMLLPGLATMALTLVVLVLRIIAGALVQKKIHLAAEETRIANAERRQRRRGGGRHGRRRRAAAAGAAATKGAPRYGLGGCSRAAIT